MLLNLFQLRHELDRVRNERDRMLQENSDIGRDKSDSDADKLRLKVCNFQNKFYKKMLILFNWSNLDGIKRSEISRNSNDG